jgi:hypothetical protein
MDKQAIHQFQQDLKHFTGSESFFRHGYGQAIYTEGVQFMAEKLGAYWLIDFILIHQQEPILHHQSFQTWKIKRLAEGGAIITAEDGNDTSLFSKQIPFTDFPLTTFTLWLVDKTLMLPSEY